MSQWYIRVAKVTKILMAILICLITLVQVNVADAEELTQDFSDVKKTDWFYGHVMDARRAGLVEGTGNNMYKPHEDITYAQYLTIISRILDETVDSKPVSNPWYAKFIDSARVLGAVDKNENVNAVIAIPREMMIKYTCKALGIEPYTGNEIIFNDVKPEDAAYLNAAYHEYLTEGTKVLGKDKRNFGFGETATRAQLAAMALRIKEYHENPVAYKEKAAQERKAAEANWQKAEDAKKAQYSIKSTDIKDKHVSAEKSRIFIEEALKGIKVNSDMSVTVTIPDILPEGWVWRIRVGCTEKDGSTGTLITTSDIVVGQTITVKPYTAASNIKEYTVKIEFDNGKSTADKGGVGSGMYISKDLIKGGKYVYVYGKGFTERPSYNP